MKQLSYQTLQELQYDGYLLKDAPERVLQFGEGNFLRAFVDYFIDVANEKAGFDGKVVVVQPIADGLGELLNQQEGLYTLYLRGFENGAKAEEKRIVSAISRVINPYGQYQAFLDCAKNPDLRYIVSNTTEAGIVFDDICKFDDAPPASFPAKLTRLLYERYRACGQADADGFVILSCELIDNNGAELLRCVEDYIRLWELDAAFETWVREKNLFCSTLVDRIVTGYPKEETSTLNAQNGYDDRLLDTGEIFALWVIEGPERLQEELPFEKAGLPVKVVRDHSPYKKQKVRILNGVHTTMSLAAFLAGKNIVRECMEDDLLRSFAVCAIGQEIIPTLTLPQDELEVFAKSVIERFQNPFIDHSLLSIALNSTAKWRARVLPTIKDYVASRQTLPTCLTFGFAAYIAFYRDLELDGQKASAKRDDAPYPISDDRHVLEFFSGHKGLSVHDLVQAVCKEQAFWGEDLNEISGFAGAVEQMLCRIDAVGMHAAIRESLQG